MAGIGAGKRGFVQHLLGIGERPTVDAIEINFLTTGKGLIKGKQGDEFDLARGVLSRAIKHEKSAEEVADIYIDRIKRAGAYIPGTAALSESVRGHTAHHWFWDTAKGTRTGHEAMIDVMQNPVIGSRGMVIELEDGESGDDWANYRITAPDRRVWKLSIFKSIDPSDDPGDDPGDYIVSVIPIADVGYTDLKKGYWESRPGSFTPGETKQVVKFLKSEFPDAKHLIGERVTEGHRHITQRVPVHNPKLVLTTRGDRASSEIMDGQWIGPDGDLGEIHFPSTATIHKLLDPYMAGPDDFTPHATQIAQVLGRLDPAWKPAEGVPIESLSPAEFRNAVARSRLIRVGSFGTRDDGLRTWGADNVNFAIYGPVTSRQVQRIAAVARDRIGNGIGIYLDIQIPGKPAASHGPLSIGELQRLLKDKNLVSESPDPNPIAKRPGGYYIQLPRRFSLHGAARGWLLGPFSDMQAVRIADGVRGGHVGLQRHAGGVYVAISGGFRFYGTPEIGPFSTRRAASSVLAKVLSAGREPATAPERKQRPIHERRGRQESRQDPVSRAATRGQSSRTRAAEEHRLEEQQMSQNGQDAIGALRSLGHSAADAKAAIEAVYSTDLTAEQMIRKAYRRLQMKPSRAKHNPLILLKIRTGRIKNQETGDWEQRIVRGTVPVERARMMLTPGGFEKAMNRDVLTPKDLRFEALAAAAELNPALQRNPLPIAPLLAGLLGGVGTAVGAGVVNRVMAKNPDLGGAAMRTGSDPVAAAPDTLRVAPKYFGRWQATQMNNPRMGASPQKIIRFINGLRDAFFKPESQHEHFMAEVLVDDGLATRRDSGWYALTEEGLLHHRFGSRMGNPAAPSAMSDAQTRAAIGNPLWVNPRSCPNCGRKMEDSSICLRCGPVGSKRRNPVYAVDPDYESRKKVAGTSESAYNPVLPQFLQRPLPALSPTARGLLKVEIPTTGFWRPWTQRQVPALRELYSTGLLVQTRQGFRLSKKGIELRRKMVLRGRTANPRFAMGEAVKVPSLETTGTIKDITESPGSFFSPPRVRYVDVKLRDSGEVVKLRPGSIRPLNPRG